MKKMIVITLIFILGIVIVWQIKPTRYFEVWLIPENDDIGQYSPKIGRGLMMAIMECHEGGGTISIQGSYGAEIFCKIKQGDNQGTYTYNDFQWYGYQKLPKIK